MTAAARPWTRTSGARSPSVAGLVLAGLGVAAATWVILGADGDPSRVRWWLVVAPVAIAVVPVLVPVRAARVGAMVTLGAWCLVTGFSIGLLLLPALAALVAAALREDE